MKFLIGIVTFIPAIAAAAGYGGAHGLNKLGEDVSIEIVVYDPPRGYINGLKDGKPERYDIAKECPTFFKVVEGGKFSCIREGRSPLAGTTYRITTSAYYTPCDVEPYFNKSAGEVYICVDGCNNPRAPQIFYVTPWECG